MDSQGEDYQFHYTLPSQSQLEDNISKLTIRELQFEDDDNDLGGDSFQTIGRPRLSGDVQQVQALVL